MQIKSLAIMRILMRYMMLLCSNLSKMDGLQGAYNQELRPTRT
jgi:hypothetical protein